MGKEIQMNPNENAQVSINPNDLEDVLCEKCECQSFDMAFLFKKISAVLSPSGKESLIPIQVYKCTECGHINDGFMPKANPDA
jgi:hypothetical protein